MMERKSLLFYGGLLIVITGVISNTVTNHNLVFYGVWIGACFIIASVFIKSNKN